MKTKRDGEELVKVAYKLPKTLKQALEDMAVAERRSMNDQLIVLLARILTKEDDLF